MDFDQYCKTCKDSVHCCIFKRHKGFTFVSIKDAKKIKRHAQKEFPEFLEYTPLKKETVALLRKEDPALEGYLRSKMLDKEGRLLKLKVQKNGYCIFLDRLRTCSIYKIRPNICRIYPFWAIRLLSRKLKVIEHDSNPDCPIILSRGKDQEDISDALTPKQIIDIKKTFIIIEKEQELYRDGIKRFVKENLKAI